jgi:hypothetical protein
MTMTIQNDDDDDQVERRYRRLPLKIMVRLEEHNNYY